MAPLSLIHLPPSLLQRARRFAHRPDAPAAWRQIHVPQLATADGDIRGARPSIRNYTAPAGSDADELTLAYLRYIELHGHALHDPKGGCFTASRGNGRSETKTFGFWSDKAAREFDLFWERYRLVYGHGGRDGLAAA